MSSSWFVDMFWCGWCQVVVIGDYWLAGKLEIRLMGCQGLLEDIPGRTRKDSKSYPVLSPGESRTFPRSGSTKSYSLKQKERSSEFSNS